MEARFLGPLLLYVTIYCKNHYRLILLIAKFLDNEETVFKQKQTEKTRARDREKERDWTHKCDTIATAEAVADDEKRQNKRRRWSSGIERIFFLKHTSVAKIRRWFFFLCFFSDCNTIVELCVHLVLRVENFLVIMVIWTTLLCAENLYAYICCLS